MVLVAAARAVVTAAVPYTNEQAVDKNELIMVAVGDGMVQSQPWEIRRRRLSRTPAKDRPCFLKKKNVDFNLHIHVDLDLGTGSLALYL